MRARADKGMTVQDAVDEFLIDCQMRNLSEHTVIFYRTRLRLAFGDLGTKLLSGIRIADVKSRIAELMEGRAAATLNGYLRTVKCLIYWCQDQDYDVSISPRQLHRIKEPKHVPTSFSVEQMNRLLAQPDRRTFQGLRDYAMMSFMLDTGARASEVTGVMLKDIDMPIVKLHGKGDKDRLVSLSPGTQVVVSSYIRSRFKRMASVQDDEGWLFVSRYGGHYSHTGMYGMLKRYAASAGISEDVNVHPHAFRSTFATHFLRNGGNIIHLQQIMGHTTLAMSRYYASVVDSDAFESSMQNSPMAMLTTGGTQRRRRGPKR